MARKQRITILGYYHIVNRGVEKRNIFLQFENMNILSKPNKKSKRKILIDFKIDKLILKQRKIKKK